MCLYGFDKPGHTLILLESYMSLPRSLFLLRTLTSDPDPNTSTHTPMDVEGAQAAAAEQLLHMFDGPIMNQRPPGGPRYERIRKTVIRNFDRAYQAVMDDYLCSNPMYGEATFRRRFRTSTNVYNKIREAVLEADPFFERRPHKGLKLGIHTDVKMLCALKQLATGAGADAFTDYFCVSDYGSGQPQAFLPGRRGLFSGRVSSSSHEGGSAAAL
jgi:hypothetical protein